MATLQEIESQIAALQLRKCELDANVMKNGVFDGDVIGAQGNVDKQIRSLQSRRVAILSGLEDPAASIKLAPPVTPTPSQLRPPRWITSDENRKTAASVHEHNIEVAKSLPLDTPQEDIRDLYATEARVALVEKQLREYATDIVENARACEFNENFYAAIIAMFWRESSLTAASFHWAGNQRKLLAERVEALEARRHDPLSPIQMQHLEVRLRPVIEAEFAKTVAPLLMRIEELETRPPMKYAGVWSADRQYTPGNFVTDRGSVFHCNEMTRERPGDGKVGRSRANVETTEGMPNNMPKNTVLSNLAVNVQADKLAAELDGGFIDIFDGEMPLTADFPITTQTLGVSLTFGNPACRPPVAGVLIANPITPGVAVASIVPSWARIFKADHKTPIMDVSAGTTNATLVLPVATLERGITTSLAFTHVIPKSAPGS